MSRLNHGPRGDAAWYKTTRTELCVSFLFHFCLWFFGPVDAREACTTLELNRTQVHELN